MGTPFEQFVQSVYSANTPADERASLKTLIIENNHDITRQPTFIKLDPSQPVDAIPDAMYGGGLTAEEKAVFDYVGEGYIENQGALASRY